jgi:hypothetical protein
VHPASRFLNLLNVDPQVDLTRLFCSATAKTRAAKITMRRVGSFRTSRQERSGASVLFLLLERVLLLALVMLVNERHCVRDQHERREDDNDHIRSPAVSTSTVPRGDTSPLGLICYGAG